MGLLKVYDDIHKWRPEHAWCRKIKPSDYNTVEIICQPYNI